jgi:hypothetical protein
MRRKIGESGDSLWKRSESATRPTLPGPMEEVEKTIKSAWSEDLRHAYRELQAESNLNGNRKGKLAYEKAAEEAKNVDPELKSLPRGSKRKTTTHFRRG